MYLLPEAKEYNFIAFDFQTSEIDRIQGVLEVEVPSKSSEIWKFKNTYKIFFRRSIYKDSDVLFAKMIKTKKVKILGKDEKNYKRCLSPDLRIMELRETMNFNFKS